MMTCRQIQSQLSDCFDERGPEPQRRSIALHVHACRDCRRRWEALRQLTEAFKHLPVPELTEPFVQDLLQTRETHKPTTLLPRAGRAVGWIIVLLSVGAVFLWIRHSRPESAAKPLAASVVVTPPQVIKTPPIVRPIIAAPPVLPTPKPRRSPAAKISPLPNESAIRSLVFDVELAAQQRYELPFADGLTFRVLPEAEGWSVQIREHQKDILSTAIAIGGAPLHTPNATWKFAFQTPRLREGHGVLTVTEVDWTGGHPGQIQMHIRLRYREDVHPERRSQNPARTHRRKTARRSNGAGSGLRNFVQASVSHS